MEVADIAETSADAESTYHDANTSSSAARFAHLVRVLEDAAATFRSGAPREREAAFAEGLAAVTALYRGLDGGRPDVTAAHLDRIYDATLRALGEAYAGDLTPLVAATAMARCIHSALAPPTAAARPSRPDDLERRAA
ncbi:MAG: hypothetical protein KIS78_12610 [Labilithrix sp.]|nr:hypothetical protein [Labilithrix sp.]MCW5833234.1 hypothetical protein [Labilithrix sp.]